MAHIISKHGDDVMERIPETIARGRMVNVQGRGTPGTRVTLNNGNNTTVLSLYRHGARDTWGRQDGTVHTQVALGKCTISKRLHSLTLHVFVSQRELSLIKGYHNSRKQSRATKPLPLAANKATYRANSPNETQWNPG